MPIPEFTHIDFDKDDDPYADGSGYLEKFQQLSQNFTDLAQYNNTVQFSVEQTTQNIIDQTASDRSAIEGLITTTVGTLTSAQAADRLLAQEAAQTSISNSLAAAQIAASIGDVAARVMPMLVRRSLDTVTAMKFKAAEGWEKVGNHTWMNEIRPTGRMLGEFASAAAAWASTVDGVAAASGDYYWDTGINAQLELTTHGNTQFANRFGSRHFPLEALFVLWDSSGSKELLIFDLTHPLIPVWKRAIVSGSGQWRRFLPYAIFTSMDYQNGVLVLGSNHTINSGAINASYVRGVAIADFKNDRAIHYKERDGYSQSKSNVWQKGLANWNSSTFMPNSSGDNSTGGFLQSYTPNVSFLPGGHITAAAGAGFTVIKPDLNSSVKANSTTHWEAAVELNGRLYAIYDVAVASGWLVNFGLTENLSASFTADNSWTPSSIPALSGRLPIALAAGDDSLLFSSTTDLQQLWPNPADPDSSLYAHRGLNYATPPMIKPALMLICGTDEGTFSGDANFTATFDSDLDGFIDGSSGTGSVTVSGGKAVLQSNGAGNIANLDREITGLTIGQEYYLGFTYSGSSGRVSIGTTQGAGNVLSYASNPVGVNRKLFTATATTMWVRFFPYSDDSSVGVDDVSFFNYLVSRDFSGLNKHATINGTLTATALTAGGVAGLSGWSDTNNVVVPYQSELDVGAGDFFYQFAFVLNSGDIPGLSSILFTRSDDSIGTGRIVVLVTTSETLNFTIEGSGINSSFSCNDGLVHTGMAYRRSGVIYLEIDGEIIGSAANTTSITNVSANTYIGMTPLASDRGWNGTIWFAGASAVVPTKIERALMHKRMRNLIEGKAGLDEAPSKLAYDPIRKAFEMVGDTYRQTLQDGAIAASIEHESGDSPVICVGSRSEVAIGGGINPGSLLIDVPERNLREKTLTLITERKTVTYEGDATGSRVLFPDPTDDAEVAEVIGWRPVLVHDDGVEQTKGAADDYTIADYGLGRYCVEFATEPADGNNVDIVFEREVWK